MVLVVVSEEMASAVIGGKTTAVMGTDETAVVGAEKRRWWARMKR